MNTEAKILNKNISKLNLAIHKKEYYIMTK